MSFYAPSHWSQNPEMKRQLKYLYCAGGKWGYDGNTKEWMREMSALIRDYPLGNICIPGTHDSGTEPISTASDIDSTAPSVVKNLGNVSLLREVVRPIAVKWAKTQEMSIGDQLNQGIRYLDIRITGETKDRLWIVHAMRSMWMSQMVDAVSNFLNQTTHEIVIIDVNHMYNYTEGLIREMMTYMSQRFGNKLCPPETTYDVLYSKIGDILMSPIRVFVIWDNIPAMHKCVDSEWINTNNPQKLFVKLNEGLKNRYKKGGKPSPLFVSQLVMTPEDSQIASDANPFVGHSDGIIGFANEVNERGAEWWLNEADKSTRNILLSDFSGRGDLIRAVIQGNNSLFKK